MRVLITGGGGFIGAWIIKRLVALGHAVRVLDVKEDRRLIAAIAGETAAHDAEWVVGDIAASGVVSDAAKGCDTIFHLAAVLTPACQKEPHRGAEINLMGSLNVFEAARAHGLRQVVYMSSAGVFGPDDGTTPRPTTLYGAWKLASEGIARAYAEDHGIASVGFRPLVVYGPGRETGLTAGPTLACRAVAEGKPYVIPFSGETDLIYVDDVAAAFVAAGTREITGAHVHNLKGEVVSAAQVADLLRDIVPGAEVRAEGPTLPVAARLASTRVEALLPGLPVTRLRAGLSNTVAFYRERPTL